MTIKFKKEINKLKDYVSCQNIGIRMVINRLHNLNNDMSSRCFSKEHVMQFDPLEPFEIIESENKISEFKDVVRELKKNMINYYEEKGYL
jgi:hypothetical protein